MAACMLRQPSMSIGTSRRSTTKTAFRVCPAVLRRNVVAHVAMPSDPLAPSPISVPEISHVRKGLFYNEDPALVGPNHPEIVTMRAWAGWGKNVSDAALWVELALAAAATGCLAFAAISVSAGFPILPRLLTAASAATAFLAAAFAWNLRSSVKELKKGGVVAPSWISGNLLRCNALNIIGLFASVLAVQAALGASVVTSIVASSPTITAVSGTLLDNYCLQAATVAGLSHLVSMVYTNLLFRFVRNARYLRNGALQSWDGGAALCTLDLHDLGIHP